MSADAVAGRYNVVLADDYETFDHRIPVETFVDDLEDGVRFDEVCVINLGETLADGDPVRLSRAMQDRATDFDRTSATIQFSVEGSIQSVPGGFELLYEEELYNLNQVFGGDLIEREEGWLTATF
jgi:hypothetical protein